MLVLSSRGPPGVVEFETLVAEVGFAVGAALSGLQRLRRFTETAHYRHAAQADRLPVPEEEDEGQSSGKHCSTENKNLLKKF